MNSYDVYKDIAERTGGDIYIYKKLYGKARYTQY